MSKKNFHIDFKFTSISGFEDSEYPNVDELFGKIFFNDNEKDIFVEAGKIELHLYDFSFIDYGFNLYDAFDRSFDTVKLGNAIFDYRTKRIKKKIENQIGLAYNLNILVIHDLMLFDEFRGKEYGVEIINEIEEVFNDKCGIIALQSFPKQHDVSVKDTKDFQKFKLKTLDDNIVTAQKSLNKFYEKCGFVRIRGEKDCYIKNIAPA